MSERKKERKTSERAWKERKDEKKEKWREAIVTICVCVNLWENTVNRCALAYIVWLYTIISRQKKKRSQSIWDEIFIGIVTVLFSFVFFCSPRFTFSSRIISILKSFMALRREEKSQERWSVKKFLLTIDKRTNFYDSCVFAATDVFRHIVSYTLHIIR